MASGEQFAGLPAAACCVVVGVRGEGCHFGALPETQQLPPFAEARCSTCTCGFEVPISCRFRGRCEPERIFRVTATVHKRAKQHGSCVAELKGSLKFALPGAATMLSHPERLKEARYGASRGAGAFCVLFLLSAPFRPLKRRSGWHW